VVELARAPYGVSAGAPFPFDAGGGRGFGAGSPVSLAQWAPSSAAAAPPRVDGPIDPTAVLVSLLTAADRHGMLHKGGDIEVPIQPLQRQPVPGAAAAVDGAPSHVSIPSGSAIVAAVEFLRQMGRPPE
jgi:hypothetical protein